MIGTSTLLHFGIILFAIDLCYVMPRLPELNVLKTKSKIRLINLLFVIVCHLLFYTNPRLDWAGLKN